MALQRDPRGMPFRVWRRTKDPSAGTQCPLWFLTVKGARVTLRNPQRGYAVGSGFNTKAEGSLRTILGILSLAGAVVGIASAGTINYNTTGSTLSCNGVSGCTQNTTTQVIFGGLTLTYNTGSGSGVVTPSIINLGNILSTGTVSNVNITGLLLTINVNSTPPGAGGTLPNGAISGSISTNNSGATIQFAPNNTTSGFGTLPGVVIAGGGQAFLYQILNPTLGVQAPTVGNPIGQTSIQGAVTDLTAGAPEPSTMVLLSAGLGLAALLRRRMVR